MTSTKTLWFAAAVPILWKERVNASGYRRQARFEANAEVKVLHGTDAPISIRLHREDHSVDWRLYNGTLWRPLLDGRGNPLALSIDDLSALLLKRGQQGVKKIVGVDWSDNPFGPSRAAGLALTSNPWDAENRSDMDDKKVHDDNIETTREHLAGMAARDLVEIDGVIHRRSLQPVWATGAGLWLQYAVGGVRAQILDFEQGKNVPCVFNHDRRDEAMRFAEEMQERLEDARGSQTPERYLPTEPTFNEWIEQVGDLPDFDAGAKGLDNAAWSVLNIMEEMNFRNVGYEVMRMTVRFVGACLDKTEPDLDEAVEIGQAAFETLASRKDWPRLAEGLAIMGLAGERARLMRDMRSANNLEGLRI